jgi:DNA-binding GntR family transcriptional regulator
VRNSGLRRKSEKDASGTAPSDASGFLTADAPSEPAQTLDGGASTQHAYDELRRKILQGELAPGATFSQVQLSTQLGVSRTPLREAVRLLQMEGLLRTDPRRRVRVSPLSTEDFEDLYAIRIALESLAVRLTVPQLSEAELA